MKTIATMTLNGRYKVMYDDKAKCNPYRVYQFIGNHRRMINKYADLHSAMLELTNIVYICKTWGEVERSVKA